MAIAYRACHVVTASIATALQNGGGSKVAALSGTHPGIHRLICPLFSIGFSLSHSRADTSAAAAAPTTEEP
jgi:hypothetical protein